MDGSQVLRAVRRRKGWSQRELAAASRVPLRTVAAVEGGRTPTVAVLTAVLAAADLELAVDVVPPEVAPPVRAHLQRSLTKRLERAIGGPRRPRLAGDPGSLWDQLRTLAACGSVVLHGDAARALWLPPGGELQTAQVCFVAWPPWAPAPTPDLTLIQACGGHAAAVVAVSLESWTVGVDPPGELALQPAHAEDRAGLRAVAALLHREAAVDEAGRRVAAHKDAAHAMEAAYVFHTKRFGQRPPPDPRDRRGWRLADDASHAAWLLRRGHPI